MTEDNYFTPNSSNEDSEAFSHAKRNQQYVSYRKENVSQGSNKYPGNRDAQRHHFKSRDPGEDDKKAMFSPKTKSHGHRTSSHIHKHEDPCDAEFDAKMAKFSPIAKSYGHRTRSPVHEREDPCEAEYDAKMAALSRTAKSHRHRTRSPIHEQEDPCNAEFDAKMAALSPTAKSHRHRTCRHIHKHEDPCDAEFDAASAMLSPIAKSHGYRNQSHVHKHEDPCDAEFDAENAALSQIAKCHHHRTSSHKHEDLCDADFDAFSHDKRNQQYASSAKENVSARHSKKLPGHRHSPRHRSKSRDHGEDDETAAITSVAKSHSHRTSSHIHKQEDPCDPGAVKDMYPGKTEKRSTLWRKSREQHRKEKEAATAIQSAWRGYQVRREMSTLDEAATQIQAAFRGYQTRKELPLGFSWISGEELDKKMSDKSKSSMFSEMPLGLCDCSWISGGQLDKKMRDKIKSSSFPEVPLGDSSWISGEQLKKKMRGKSKSGSLPEGLHYFQELEVAPGVHVGRESIIIPSSKHGSFPKGFEESVANFQPLLDMNSPQMGVLAPPILKQSLDDPDVRRGCESIFLPSGKQGSFPKSLEESVAAFQPLLDMNSPQMGVLVPSILKQSLDDADATIQAALSGQQSCPKVISAMLQGEQSGKPYCSNLTIEKIVRKQLASGHTLEQHEVRGIIAKSSGLSVRSIPRVRNINILAIVKRMPVSVFKKPGVTIRVSSPNAVVQGYQKDMSSGVRGLYTIKNRYSQRPSQILIHVNLQNEKDVECCP